MKAAEGQLDDIPNLPSARLKRKVAVRSFTHLLPLHYSSNPSCLGQAMACQDAHAHSCPSVVLTMLLSVTALHLHSIQACGTAFGY